MKTQIRTSTLKAALHCVAVRDERPALNGVLLDIKNKHIVVVSTDGHCLSAFIETPIDYAPDCREQIIIPTDIIKSAIKLAGKNPLVEFEITPENTHSLGGVKFTPIDGRYPDYRRVTSLSNDAPATTAQFYNPGIMNNCLAAVREFHSMSKKYFPYVSMYQNKCAIHRGDDTSIVILMPWRTDNAPCLGLRAD